MWSRSLPVYAVLVAQALVQTLALPLPYDALALSASPNLATTLNSRDVLDAFNPGAHELHTRAPTQPDKPGQSSRSNPQDLTEPAALLSLGQQAGNEARDPANQPGGSNQSGGSNNALQSQFGYEWITGDWGGESEAEKVLEEQWEIKEEAARAARAKDKILHEEARRRRKEAIDDNKKRRAELAAAREQATSDKKTKHQTVNEVMAEQRLKRAEESKAKQAANKAKKLEEAAAKKAKRQEGQAAMEKGKAKQT